VCLQVEAKWHANYHLLRCWLDSGSGTLQQLLQGSLPAAAAAAAAISAADSSSSHSDVELPSCTEQAPAAAATEESSGRQQQQQGLPAELHEAAAWLQRQVVLYNKLKLTPVKVTMLRRLGRWQLASWFSTRAAASPTSGNFLSVSAWVAS
jgi:hypothetical protein